MRKSSLDKEKQEKKRGKVVTMPDKTGDAEIQEVGGGGEGAGNKAPHRGRKKKVLDSDAKEELHKGAKKALTETACKYRRIYRQGGQTGWLTTSVSRPAVLGRLNAALVEEPGRFQSRRLLGECRSFVRMANGSSGARAGTHDDRVMAMAIGLAARAELAERSRAAS
jgi:hypothetical protein